MCCFTLLYIFQGKKKKISCSQQLFLELTLSISAPKAKQKYLVSVELIIVENNKKRTYFSAKTTSEYS